MYWYPRSVVVGSWWMIVGRNEVSGGSGVNAGVATWASADGSGFGADRGAGDDILDVDEGGEYGDNCREEDGAGEKRNKTRDGANSGSDSCGTGSSLRKVMRTASEINRFCSWRSSFVLKVEDMPRRSSFFEAKLSVNFLVTDPEGMSFTDSSSSSGRRRSNTSLTLRIGKPDIEVVRRAAESLVSNTSKWIIAFEICKSPGHI